MSRQTRDTKHETREKWLSCLVSRVSCLVILVAPALVQAQDAVPRKETAVGLTGRLEGLVLPGPELEAIPNDDRKRSIVIQELKVYPHGTAFRYDIAYHGLDPGVFDLRDYLRRKDGKPAAGLPPIWVKVVPVRPPGQVEPNELKIEAGPRLGGYRVLIIVGLIVWGLGLIALILSFFFPRRRLGASAIDHPVSLADRLRPLVEGAIAQRLSQPELASLERALLAYWRRRLELEAVEPAHAIATLRTHPEAGPLLNELESWLHRPGPPARVNVADLLKPYRDLPPDTLDLRTETKAVSR